MHIRSILFALLITFAATTIQAQQKVIQLYSGAAPGSENWNWNEKEDADNFWNTRLVYNVSHPTLTVFSPDPSVNKGTAVIICPGGAFYVLAIDKEGNDVAKWLAKKGITCFVLKYRLGHILTDDPAQEVTSKMGKKEFGDTVAAIVPLEIADARAAISYVRKHASEYKISPERIGIIGFSAGGTVTASTAFNYNAENRPDFVAPVYAYMPASLQSDVPADAPPMFLTAATDDQLGLAPHSVDLYNKWVAAKHSAELHLYAKGGHGFGMRVQNIPTDTWIDRFYDWLGVQGFLKTGK
jgi:acetyl esterase/lipase